MDRAALAATEQQPRASTSFSIVTLRIRSQSPFLRYLYIKPHKLDGSQDGGAADALKDKALFVCGLPVGIGEAELGSLLGQFGEVQQVVVHEAKASAIVVFSSRDSCKACLAAANSGAVLTVSLQSPSEARGAARGLKAMVQQHKAQYGQDPAALASELDSWLQKHEADLELKQREQAAAMEAEGWTVVVRHKGRKKNIGENGVRVSGVSKAAAQAAAAGKQQQQLDNFYRFQKKDRMRNELLELRERFEEDKRRLQQLKASRKFKPY